MVEDKDVERSPLNDVDSSEEVKRIRREIELNKVRKYIFPKKQLSILIRLNTTENSLSKFEEYLIASDNKSSIISLVLNEYENDHFWTDKVRLHTILQHYVGNKEVNLLNFFSILLSDWNDQTGPKKNYYLVKKFQIFEEISGGTESIFDKLLEVINDDNLYIYYEISLKIIYYYFDEINQNFSTSNDSKCSVFDDAYMKNLVNKALSIKNERYKTAIVKILLTYLNNTKDYKFQVIKEKILSSFITDLDYTSICKISYESIVQYCDGQFFKLVFYLKENLVLKFKAKFTEFINYHKQCLGEFWKNALKLNAQLLYQMAKNQRLVDTQEFILISTNIFELKHSITSYYKDYADFYIVFYDLLDEKEEKLLLSLTDFIENNFIEVIDDFEFCVNRREFKNLFKNTKTIRKLLFGRKSLDSESLFEKILLKNRSHAYPQSDHGFVLDYIWNEFQLWDKPEIYTLRNPSGKLLLDYVLETNNDHHLITFLMPISDNNSNTINEPCHYMMLKNSLYYDCRRDNNDKSLIQYHLNLIDKNNGTDFANIRNLFYLFEEISLHNSEQLGKNEYIRNLFDKLTSEQSEKFDGKNELTLPRKHFLIGIMMIYWMHEAKLHTITFIFNKKDEGTSFDHGALFFKMLFLIINGKDKEFNKELPMEMEKLENCFKLFYELESTYDNKHQLKDSENIFHFYEKYSTNFFFVLLYAAIKTNQFSIVEQIFMYNNFLITTPTFPTNMKPQEIHSLTTLKFIENKYEIGRAIIPRNWLTYDVFERFLNSRIDECGSFYKINCRFMLPYYNHDVNIKPSSDLNDDLLFNEDYETMEYIIKDPDLRTLVSHPVMELIINLKIQKYRNIQFWNQMAFILSYMLPTLALVYLFHSRNALNGSWQLRYSLINFFNLSRLPYIIGREYFQYRFFYNGSLKKYFNEKSNIVECGLIVLPIILLLFTVIHFTNPLPEYYEAISLIENINIIFMLIAIAYQFSNTKFLTLLTCFKKIFSIYLNVLIIFLPFFFGFLALRFIIMSHDAFSLIPSEIFNYFIMYSGIPLTDNSRTYAFLQGVLITLIVILIINKINLILSITINDIHLIMRQSRETSLIHNARKYIEYATAIRFFNAITEYKQKSLSEILILKSIRVFLRKYIYVHRPQTLYVDKITRHVHVDANKSIFEHKILPNLFEYYKLDVETMDALRKIVKNSTEIGDRK